MAPTATSDRQCLGCDWSVQYWSAVDEAPSCVARITSCAAGTGSSSSPGRAEDYSCEACADDEFNDGSSLGCAEHRDCDATQYESAAPTATSNRVCTELTDCQPSEEEVVAPTATRDRQCLGCDWSVQYWSSVDGTPSCVDRITSCAAGTGSDQAVAELAADEDYSCDACDPGTFNDGSSLICQNHRSACARGEEEVAAPTATGDRLCEACEGDRYSPGGTGAASACRQRQSCELGYGATEEPDVDKNRSCGLCRAGSFGAGGAALCEPCAPGHYSASDGASACLPHTKTECDVNSEVLSLAPTATNDIECCRLLVDDHTLNDNTLKTAGGVVVELDVTAECFVVRGTLTVTGDVSDSVLLDSEHNLVSDAITTGSLTITALTGQVPLFPRLRSLGGGLDISSNAVLSSLSGLRVLSAWGGTW